MEQGRSVYCLPLLALIGLQMFSGQLIADQLEFAGQSFPYQAYERIDQNTGILILAGKRTVIKAEELIPLVVRSQLSDPEYEISNAEFLALSREAHAEGFELADSLLAYSDRLDLKAAEAASLAGLFDVSVYSLQQILALKESAFKYQLLLAKIKDSKFSLAQLDNCCQNDLLLDFYLSRTDGSQPDLVKLTAREQQFFKEQLGELTDFSSLQALNHELSENQAIRSVNGRVEDLIRMAEQYPDHKIRLKGYYQRNFAQGNQLHSLISKNQLKRALDLIQLESLLGRTENTHEALISLIEKVNRSNYNLLQISQNQRLLRTFAAKDPRIKKAIVLITDQVIESLLAAEKYFAALELFNSQADYFKPDELARAGDLLVKITRALDKAGHQKAARTTLLAHQDLVGSKEKLRLFSSGTIVNLQFLIFLFAVLALIIFICLRFKTFYRDLYELVFFRGSKTAKSSTNSRLNRAEQARKIAADNLDAQTFIYQGLLKKFKLDENADQRQIKKRYRQIIKDYHPDLNPEQTAEDKGKFLKITEDYEQLLKLVKQRKSGGFKK